MGAIRWRWWSCSTRSDSEMKFCSICSTVWIELKWIKIGTNYLNLLCDKIPRVLVCIRTSTIIVCDSISTSLVVPSELGGFVASHVSASPTWDGGWQTQWESENKKNNTAQHQPMEVSDKKWMENNLNELSGFCWGDGHSGRWWRIFCVVFRNVKLVCCGDD